jgi:hypothetical protein
MIVVRQNSHKMSAALLIQTGFLDKYSTLELCRFCLLATRAILLFFRDDLIEHSMRRKSKILINRSISIVSKYMQQIGEYRLKPTDLILFVDINNVKLGRLCNRSSSDQATWLNRLYFRQASVTSVVKMLETIFTDVSKCLSMRATTDENLKSVNVCSEQFEKIIRIVKRILVLQSCCPRNQLGCDKNITSILIQKDMTIETVLGINQQSVRLIFKSQ